MYWIIGYCIIVSFTYVILNKIDYGIETDRSLCAIFWPLSLIYFIVLGMFTEILNPLSEKLINSICKGIKNAKCN